MESTLPMLKRYLRVYWAFLTTSISQALSFRFNFFFLLFLQTIFFATNILTIHLLYSSVDHIGTWNEEQFLFFVCFMITVTTMHDAFVTRNYWVMCDLLIKGDLDFILLRPLHPIFSTYFRYARPSMMLMSVPMLIATVYFGLQVDLHWIGWVALPFLLVASIALCTLIGMLFTSGMFWLLQGSGVNFIRIQAQEISRWPDYVFTGGIRWAFTTLLPLLLIGSAPVRFMFDPNDWVPLATMLIAAFILFRVILFIWSKGLLAYESASS